MALVVETGSGASGSESYAAIAEIAAYATARGLTFVITGGTNAADAEAAARRGTVWLDGRYRSSFPGRKTNGRAQALEWPRINAYDRQVPPEYIESDEIPQEIIDACCEAAIREKASPGSLSPDVTPGKIKKSAKVGDIGVEYAIGTGTVGEQRPVATVIDDILSGLLAIQRGPVLFGKVERA